MEENVEKIEQKSVVLYMPWSLLVLFLVYAALGIVGICLRYTLVLYLAWLQSAIVAALILTMAIIAFQRKIASQRWWMTIRGLWEEIHMLGLSGLGLDSRKRFLF